MKKFIAVIVLFSMLFILTPFAIQAQYYNDKARVTIAINQLHAISTDACPGVGGMDFFAIIRVGRSVKRFKVEEGNNLYHLDDSWQFTHLTSADKVTFTIEIWDDDDAFCGGGDDRVNVDGRLSKITKTLSTLEPYDQEIRSWGVQNSRNIGGDDNEVAFITYRITIVPARVVTPAFLTIGNWRKKRVMESINGAVTDIDFLNTHLIETCKKDDYYQFNLRGTYRLDEGPAKCNLTDPQVIEVGKWSFIDNGNKLQLYKEGAEKPQVFSIVSLTASSLILSQVALDGSRRTLTYYIH